MKADSPRAGSSLAAICSRSFPSTARSRPDGELAIGGVGVRDLAERFGTPAYIVDEAGLRNQARRMNDGLAARHPDSEVVFASKSFPCLAVYKLFAAEGLSIDVAGAGELVMALAAGVPPERMYLHGNAKTTAELTMALAGRRRDRGGGQLRRHRPAGTAGHPPAAGADPDHPRGRAGNPRVAVHRRRRLQVRAAPRPGPRGDRPDPRQREAAAGRAAPAHRVADPGHRAVRPGRRGGRRARRVPGLRRRRRPRRPVHPRGRGARPSSSTWTRSPRPPAPTCRPAPSSSSSPAGRWWPARAPRCTG